MCFRWFPPSKHNILMIFHISFLWKWSHVTRYTLHVMRYALHVIRFSLLVLQSNRAIRSFCNIEAIKRTKQTTINYWIFIEFHGVEAQSRLSRGAFLECLLLLYAGVRLQSLLEHKYPSKCFLYFIYQIYLNYYDFVLFPFPFPSTFAFPFPFAFAFACICL